MLGLLVSLTLSTLPMQRAMVSSCSQRTHGTLRSYILVTLDIRGIFAVYQDNDPTKDISVGDIVRTIKNLVDAGVPIVGQLYSRNAWRYL